MTILVEIIPLILHLYMGHLMTSHCKFADDFLKTFAVSHLSWPPLKPVWDGDILLVISLARDGTRDIFHILVELQIQFVEIRATIVQ